MAISFHVSLKEFIDLWLLKLAAYLFFFLHDISTAAGGLSCWVSKCSKWKEILLSFHERSFSFITLITMVVFVDNNVHIFLNLFLSFLDKSQNNNFFL